MNKPIYILITFLLGFGLGIWAVSCAGKQEALEDPQIHRLKEEIGWRDFKEAKIKDSLKFERSEKHILAKENITLRTKAEQAEAKLIEHRHETPPLTAKDTISFLMEDTTLCDSALLQSKALVAGLTIEVMTDNAIIKNLDSLNSNLVADKKDLQKIDTLHQDKEKKLEKKSKKNFWKGFSWGAIFLGAAELAWKLALFLL